MRKSITILTLILLCAVLAGPVLSQVRPLDPTPPNPAPNIPASSVPKVTQPTPPQPVAPAPATSEPISPTASALPETDKQPDKSQPDTSATNQRDPAEYMFMALIALIILGFGILIGRMSVGTRSKG